MGNIKTQNLNKNDFRAGELGRNSLFFVFRLLSLKKKMSKKHEKMLIEKAKAYFFDFKIFLKQEQKQKN